MNEQQILKELRFLGIVLAVYILIGTLLIFFVDAATITSVIQLGIVVILVVYITRTIFNIMQKMK
ncbi:hypothetical protein [Chondrinema litorale]|uniref:hypothetical protein n=1 Tax=Chondrinema litorale TaxID=2994555 RepID=UPI000C4B0D96|nr:hypothetical protein [Chondrinema litorale]MBT31459.1 hypothetical protein [Thalassovita sp.]UZR95108.1 hypothetical protein OQ292_04665 [Chondrinema litorale]